MIERAFELCKAQQKNDKELLRQIRETRFSGGGLKLYYKDVILKADEDTQILFNWFIGTNFNISTNELDAALKSNARE